MSTFKVAVEEIDTISPHPQADRLEVASLKGLGFQFVVRKDKHRPGDKVFYFPIDAVLSPAIQEILGLSGKLGDKSRINTVKLCGFVSQGIVEFPQAFVQAGLLPAKDYRLGDDVTEALGIIKYVTPDNDTPTAILRDLPSVISVYDIEGVDRYLDLAELLMDVPVHITEKLEGANIGHHLEPNDTLRVLSRENEIVEKPGCIHYMWETTRREAIEEKLAALAQRFPGRQVTTTAEIVGPNCTVNYYQLPTQTIRFFDFRLDGQFMDDEIAYPLLQDYGLTPVPSISRGKTLREWLNGRTITQAAHGQSLFNPKKIREGIVIKPMKEMRNPKTGRLILKMRDPVYLAKTGN